MFHAHDIKHCFSIVLVTPFCSAFVFLQFQLSLHNSELIVSKENTEQYYNLLSEKNFFKGIKNMYLCLFMYNELKFDVYITEI